MKSADSPASCSAVFDHAVLTARCMGNPTLVQKVLRTFLASFGQDHDELSRGLQEVERGLPAAVAQGLKTVRSLAHRMRGASGNIAAERLHARCGDLELVAEEGDRGRTLEVARELTTEWIEFQALVATGLNAGKESPCGS